MVEQAIRAKFVDRVIVAHAIYRQLLVQGGIPERKIRVVLDAPDPNIFKWRQRDHDAPRLPFTIVSYGATTSRLDGPVPLPIVLNSGSIASLLRIDVAIHAISLLWHRVPDIRLRVIGGSDDYVFRARAVTEFLNLRTHVTFHNQPSLKALPGILENASLGLVSNDSISAAGMSLPPQLMRYAALGIPSVAPRLRSIEAYFGEDAVRLYESGNARALAGAIVNLYEHPDVRREMARDAVSIAESLGWEHQRRQLLEAIDSLLEEESGAQAASDSSSGPGWWSLGGWLRQGRQIAWLRSNRWRGEKPPLIILRGADIIPEQPIVLEIADAIRSVNVLAFPAFSGCLPELGLRDITDKLRHAILDRGHRLVGASMVRVFKPRWPRGNAVPLPACRRCTAQLLSPAARFCTKCGAPLISSRVGALKHSAVRQGVVLFKAGSQIVTSAWNRARITMLNSTDLLRAATAMASLVKRPHSKGGVASIEPDRSCAAKQMNPQGRFCTKCGRLIAKSMRARLRSLPGFALLMFLSE